MSHEKDSAYAWSSGSLNCTFSEKGIGTREIKFAVSCLCIKFLFYFLLVKKRKFLFYSIPLFTF